MTSSPHALSQEILRSEPVEALQLDGEVFLTCLRTARFGMIADHLFSILESEADSELLVQVVSKLAVGDVPDEVIDGIWVGRLTALAKQDGSVRGDHHRALFAICENDAQPSQFSWVDEEGGTESPTPLFQRPASF